MANNPTQKSADSNDRSSDALNERLLAGDTSALAELFGKYRARLRRVVEARLDRRLKGRVDPSDVLQEAWLNAAQRLPAFLEREGEMSLFVWMRLVASESVLNTHRKHLAAEKRDARREHSLDRAGQAVSSLILAENLLGRFSSVGNQMIRKEMQNALLETLDSMEPVDREIIIMRSFEELSNVETAQALSLSPTGASNRFVRAMTRLRDQLASIPGFLDQGSM